MIVSIDKANIQNKTENELSFEETDLVKISEGLLFDTRTDISQYPSISIPNYSITTT